MISLGYFNIVPKGKFALRYWGRFSLKSYHFFSSSSNIYFVLYSKGPSFTASESFRAS